MHLSNSPAYLSLTISLEKSWVGTANAWWTSWLIQKLICLLNALCRRCFGCLLHSLTSSSYFFIFDSLLFIWWTATYITLLESLYPIIQAENLVKHDFVLSSLFMGFLIWSYITMKHFRLSNYIVLWVSFELRKHTSLFSTFVLVLTS